VTDERDRWDLVDLACVALLVDDAELEARRAGVDDEDVLSQ
jgi:hypothetical protein